MIATTLLASLIALPPLFAGQLTLRPEPGQAMTSPVYGAVTIRGTLFLLDNVQLRLGTGNDTRLEYDTAVTPDSLVLGLGSDSRIFYITEAADIGTDWAKAQQSNPTLCLQSADETSVTERLCLAHDGTNAQLTTDSGSLIVNSASFFDVRDAILNTSGSVVVADNQQVQGFLAESAATLTLAAAATTITLTRNVQTIDCDAGGNTIATITTPFGGSNNAIAVLRFVDASCTITDTNDGAADTVDLGAAFTSGDDDTLGLIHDGTSWLEFSRETGN